MTDRLQELRERVSRWLAVLRESSKTTRGRGGSSSTPEPSAAPAQPVPAAPAPPAGSTPSDGQASATGDQASATTGWTLEYVVAATSVGLLLLGAVGLLVAALGPSKTALLIAGGSLIVLGLIAALVLVVRAGLMRWSEVRRRPWLLVIEVVATLAVVGVVVTVVHALTAESWQQRATDICWDSGNQYLAAKGTPPQVASTRLEISQRARSALGNLEAEVPLEERPRFNTMLADKDTVNDDLRQEVGLASSGQPTADVEDHLANDHAQEGRDAAELGISVCGQTTGMQ